MYQPLPTQTGDQLSATMLNFLALGKHLEAQSPQSYQFPHLSSLHYKNRLFYHKNNQDWNLREPYENSDTHRSTLQLRLHTSRATHDWSRVTRINIQLEASQYRTWVEFELTKSSLNTKIINLLTHELAQLYIYIYIYIYNLNNKITHIYIYISIMFCYLLRKITILIILLKIR